MPPVMFCMAAFAASGGFYLLLAGALSANELITAGIVAVAGGGLATVLRLGAERQIRLPVPPPRFLVRPLVALLADSGRVGLVLVRVLRHRPAGEAGTLSPQPLHAGRQARDRGRRALVILATSLAPNGYVLGQPDAEASLLVHRLAPARPGPTRPGPARPGPARPGDDPRWPS